MATENVTPAKVSNVAMAAEESVSVLLAAPQGWKKKVVPKKGKTPGKKEVVFVSPSGEEVTTRKQLDQYLRAHPGGPALSEFNWGTDQVTMDLETENRFAAMFVEEARRLQAQADKEGVLVYLHRPNVRGRPNSRFLTATVLGVEQANRAVEVNELWRAREKEKELDAQLKRRMKDRELNDDKKHISNSNKSAYSSRHEQHYRNSSNPSSTKRGHDHEEEEEDGLRDDELEEFLRSRPNEAEATLAQEWTNLAHIFLPLQNLMIMRREKKKIVNIGLSVLRNCLV